MSSFPDGNEIACSCWKIFNIEIFYQLKIKDSEIRTAHFQIPAMKLSRVCTLTVHFEI